MIFLFHILHIVLESCILLFLYIQFTQCKNKNNTNEALINKLYERINANFMYLCNQIDYIHEKNKEYILYSESNIKNVHGFQEKLADKLHVNVLNLQEMISKMNCETVYINETVYLTKRELEQKIVNIIKMQEKMVLYIQDNISELRTICNQPIDTRKLLE